MDEVTIKKFSHYMENQARLNGTGDASKKFTVSPRVQQTLETRIQESSEFLKLIGMIPVREQKGQKVGVGVNGTVAGRTNTSGGDRRSPRDVSDLSSNTYQCEKTDFDVAFPYELLDAWAGFDDFEIRLRDAVIERQALDRIMIGLRGEEAAVSTNRSAKEFLQDVNIGWLTHIEKNAPERVIKAGKVKEGAVVVGKGGDYNNLDALVYDAMEGLDPWYREHPGLRVMVGRSMLHDKYFPIIQENAGKPTEALAGDLLVSQRRIGGLPAIAVPFMKKGDILITMPKNLAIYYQRSGRRRSIIDEPAYDRVSYYESSNDAYVVEDYGFCVLIRNVEMQA